jgi:hypothetical protein
MNRNFLSPDNDPIGGDPPEPLLDPNDPNPADPPKPELSLEQQLSKYYAKGKREATQAEREKIISAFKSHNIEVVLDDKGQPDLSKTISTFEANKGNAQEAVNRLRQEYAQRDAERNQELQTLRNTLQSREIQYRLEGALGKHDVVDSEMARAGFLTRHKLEDDNGSIAVMNNDGTVMFDSTTGAEITLDRAVEEFLKKHPYLVKAISRGDGVGETPQKGSPRRVDPAKLQEAFYNEKDPAKKAQYRDQMLKAIANGQR